jgi:hypothetical protein
MKLRTIHRFVHHVVASLVLLVALLFGFASAASAQASPSGAKLGIKPVGFDGSYFSLSMQPDETGEFTVELGNFGTETVNARTYAADAYTLVNGGFGARLDGEPTSGTTHWLDYAATTLVLPPGKGVNRTFKVAVPADTKPGEYITSLVIQNADVDSVKSSDSVSIKQVTRQVIAVAITIPGPREPGLQIGAATYRTVVGNSSIAIALKNSGNVLLKLSGEFVLRNAEGAEVSRYPVTMDSVYAGTETFVEVPFAGRLNPGDYTVVLTLADESQQARFAAETASLTVPKVEEEGALQPIGVAPQVAQINQVPAVAASAGLPLNLILAGISLILGVAVLGLYFYRRNRRAGR